MEEVEEEENKSPPHRKFGFLKIVWEIENSFCVTYQNTWQICSPLFNVNGFVPIKWRFILKASKAASDAEYVASIELERHETGDITLPVQVFWNLSCERRNIIICENVGKFNTNGCISTSINNFNRLQEKLQDISTRKFYIEALILVTKSNDNSKYKRSKDIGLRALSNDICFLFNFKGYSDLTLNNGEISVRGHKAILSAGTKLLNDVIHQYSATNAISMVYSDEKTVEYMFAYLYTGNVNYVLSTPSILIDEAITRFKVKELEKHYLRDEIRLSIKHDVREFYHKWIITDILSDGLKESKSEFGDKNFNVTFELCLKQSERSGPLGIFVNGFFPLEWQELYIAFDIIDIFGHSINLKKAIRWSREDGGPTGIEDFVSADIFNVPTVTGNNTLSISCTILIPTYATSLSVVIIRNSFLSYVNPEEHYTLFSKRIESLFDSGKYSDLLIRSGNQLFRVHKCIMSARSPVFAKAISSSANYNAFYVKHVDPDTMRIFFRYVYSGVLKDYEISKMHKIYDAAVKFGMMILQHQTAIILVERLHISNVFDTIFVAHSHKNVKLKSKAFKFLMFNRSEIRDRSVWERFKNARGVYKEFKEYVRIHVGNYPELNLDDF